MAGPNRAVIEQNHDEASGETHRISHRGTGRYTFFEVETFRPDRPAWDKEEWTRIGATSKTLEEAREASRLRHLHVVELRDLPRPRIPSATGSRTPWGASQYAYAYGEGIASHGTAGHGGFKLDAKRNAQVHPALRAKGGWYEEDAEWAVVAHTFPDRFTTYERRLARNTLMNGSPDEFSAATGETVSPEQSSTLRERRFKADNADNWVGVSASMHDEDKSLVVVMATLAGKRPSHGEEWNDRTFLVPASEYESRSAFGFVIDLARHDEVLPESPAPSM